MRANKKICNFVVRPCRSWAEICGITALTLATLLAWWQPALAVVPLTVFVALCVAAPFFPQFPFYTETISRGRCGSTAISLTFDDGPSPSSTPLLLDLLARYQLTATFFVVGQQAEMYPELIARILAGGHTIGNHSYDHSYFLMFKSPESLGNDIEKTQKILARAGIRPLVFRPPVGIVSPALIPVLNRSGLKVVNFSCRACDRGNKHIDNLASKILHILKPGDILLLHDVSPSERSLAQRWHQEVETLLKNVAEQHEVIPLQDLIEHPVMMAVSRDEANEPLTIRVVHPHA